MLDKIVGIETRFAEIENELLEVGEDYQRATKLSKERAELEPIIEKSEQYRQTQEQLAQANEMASSEEGELAELASLEIQELEPRLAELENEIKALLLPKDPRDERNVIVEIRAGAGGDEAGIFASDLYRMYTRFAER